MNRLYFGDNLQWLRDRNQFSDESIDLVYLDPPFISNADYNVLFRDIVQPDQPFRHGRARIRRTNKRRCCEVVHLVIILTRARQLQNSAAAQSSLGIP